MILHRLTLRDFGLFSGEHTFSLTPRVKYGKKRPVVLIGGKNGTGKTTILEAVRLCLYGPRSLGNRVSRKEYHEYLASTVHHSQTTLLPPNQASVALEFEHVHSGEKDRYHVERRWELRWSAKEPIRESLILHKNSEPLSDFEAEHWQDFLNELIPIGLSQLFFFDGEKIQGLAEAPSSNLFLADSIKSLLGVDLVERLHSDLKIYLNRSNDHFHTEQIAQEIISAEIEQQDLKTQLNSEVERQTALEGQVAEVELQITIQEDLIAKEGGNYARQREQLKTQQARLSQKISDLEKQIQDSCGGLLPFALVPSLCEQLQAQLIEEAEIERRDSAYRALEEFFGQSEDKELWSTIANRLREQSGNYKLGDDSKRRHSLSLAESEQLLNWVDLCLTKVPEQFRELGREFEESNRLLEQVEIDLARVPSDEVLKPLMQKLSSLQQQLGGLKKDLHNATENTQSIVHRLNQIERHLDRLHESQREGQADLRRAQLVSDVRCVLGEYSGLLSERKVDALTNAVVECFGILCRKHSLVKRIEVNPLTFATSLYDQQDRLISKEQLSAGEKQIYAISLLWGLARTSGRPLPMIIDTPLGRLDSDHRGRLIEHYFPHASHQVVVLSTDTELDKQTCEMLSPDISHAYHLVYDQIKGNTNVERRYFWRTRDSAT